MEPNKIRILTLINNLRFGGAEVMTLNILKRLNSNLFTNIVCCLGGPEDLKDEYEKSGCKVIYLNTRTKVLFANIANLVKVIQREKIHIISAHLTPSILYGPLCAKLMRKPVVMTVHSQLAFKSKKLIFMESFFAKLCDRVIAISDAVKNDIFWFYGIDPKMVRLIWNGSDPQKFDPKKYINVVSDCRSKWGLPESAFVVATVASFTKNKNHHKLISSLESLKKKIPQIKLFLIGDGHLRKDLEAQVERLGLKNEVIFAGNQKDIPGCLSVIDLFVLPSIWEGFGIVLVEAMLMEKPVVATNVGSMKDIVVEGKTGLLVEPDNSDSMANAILKLFEDKAVRMSMGKEGRKRAVELFDIQKTADSFQNVLMEITTRKAKKIT